MKAALVLLFALSLFGCVKNDVAVISGLFEDSVVIGQSVSMDELKNLCANVEDNGGYLVCVSQKEFDYYKSLIVQNGKIVEIHLSEYDKGQDKLLIAGLSESLTVDKKPIHRFKGYGDLYLLGENIYLIIGYSGLADAIKSYELRVFLDSDGDYLTKIESFEASEKSKRGALYGYKLGQSFISPSLVDYSCITKVLVQLTTCVHVDYKHFLVLYSEYMDNRNLKEPEYVQINKPNMIWLDNKEIIGLQDYTRTYEDREVLMRRYGGRGRFANLLTEDLKSDVPTGSYYGVMESGDLVIIPSYSFRSTELSMFSVDSMQKVGFMRNQGYIASLDKPKAIPMSGN